MKTMTSLFVAAVFTFSSINTWADPAPFGLELGKATIADMEKKYSASYKGMNKYSAGKMYALEPSKLGISGMRSATVIFDKSSKLVAVLTSLPKNRFDELHRSLSSKYKVKSKVIPFVGNKKVVMKDGKTEVTLSAPHMGFNMELNYINTQFYKSYQKIEKAEREAKKRAENARL
jgi:hypothetical protein